MANTDQHCDISIRNRSGVPVVDVSGELNRGTMKTIESTISTLVSAGHYHVVLNIRKAVAANLRVAEALQGVAKKALKHYGAIDVVAEAGQISRLLSGSKVGKLFRFCTTENEALLRIKKLTRLPDSNEPQCSAHIKELK